MKTTTENRVRRIIIRKSDPRYAPLRALTVRSAKLWNVALDRTRSSYQVNGKRQDNHIRAARQGVGIGEQ